MLLKLITLISILAIVANCNSLDPTNPHEIFVQKKICDILSENHMGKYSSVVKIKCNWARFKDENNNLIASKQMYRGSKHLYEIIFTASTVPSDIEKYKIINKGLFSNFRLKSLSFQNLGKNFKY